MVRAGQLCRLTDKDHLGRNPLRGVIHPPHRPISTHHLLATLALTRCCVDGLGHLLSLTGVRNLALTAVLVGSIMAV